MTRLSVNLNKVALLRNSRHTGVPSVTEFGRLAHEAGADGLTVHPRPDERHIRADDVTDLVGLMRPWRPGFELNIEGYPDARLAAIVAAARPEQCTLVPDAPGAFTSDAGWRLDGAQGAVARAAVAQYRALGCRVILFVDPDPAAAALAAHVGADGIEIYTGGYAAAARRQEGLADDGSGPDGPPGAVLAACADTARAAAALGLVVNVGHDLNLTNLPPLKAVMPRMDEASIGHELTADALRDGFCVAVRRYKSALQGAAANDSRARRS